MSNIQNRAKRPNSLWVVFLAALIVLVVVIGGIAAYKNMQGSNSGTDTEEKKTENVTGTEDGSEAESTTGTEKNSETESESETESGSEVIVEPKPSDDGSETFVIFGVDSRSDQLGKGTRSDSIMLVNVNHDKGEVKVVSIYRDCMVYQDGKGYKKISNAHSYGGPDFAVSVINENFDMNIKKYVTVNFGAVSELVDKIGGVEIELNQAEVDYINSACKKQLSGAGTHLLDGEQAVYFSRIRKLAGGDYKRTERQREVLFEIFETSKTMGIVERAQLAESMLDEINTNYAKDEIISLLYYMSKYEIVTMTAYPQVFYGGSVDGSWVEVPCTLIDMNAGLYEALYGQTDYTPSERVKEISRVLRNKVSGPNIDQRN